MLGYPLKCHALALNSYLDHLPQNYRMKITAGHRRVVYVEVLYEILKQVHNKDCLYAGSKKTYIQSSKSSNNYICKSLHSSYISPFVATNFLVKCVFCSIIGTESVCIPATERF